MSRRAHHVHLQIGEEVRQSEYSHEQGVTNTWIKLACGGETLRGIKSTTDDPMKVSCPKCSTIVYEERRGDSGDVRLERVDPKTIPSYISIKSAYRVMVENEHVGYAIYPNGYGGTWKLYPIELNLDGKPVISRSMDDGLDSKTLGWRKFSSKEHVLFEATELRREGKLKSLAEKNEERKKRQAEFDEEERARRVAATEREQARNNVVEGLKSVLAKGDITLTNFERDALLEAVKLLS